ncbi:unnamed protein product, partial [Rotaria sp. Silwood1]
MHRHWTIADSSSEQRDVDGEGVVGVQPIIKPDEFFTYVSGCNLKTEIVALGSCVSSKKTDNGPIKFAMPTNTAAPINAPNVAPINTPINTPNAAAPIQNNNCCPQQDDKDSMIPFTRELYNRGLSQDKLYIDNGKVVNQYGVNENKVELPALTPGVVEAIEPDGLRVAIEGGGNNLKFINNKYSPEFFIFPASSS